MPLHGTVYGLQEEIDFAGVDFMSFVTEDTYGKPAIIAPGTDDFAPAHERGGPVTVLFVNPGNIEAAKVTKTP